MNKLREIEQYAWAFLLAALICLRLRKYTEGMHVSLTPSKALLGIAIQFGIQVPQRERLRWHNAEIQIVAAQMGFRVPRAENRKNSPGLKTVDMGGSDRNIWIQTRMKVAAMRVERGIQQKYRVHVLEHSNLSKTWFVLTIWVFRFTLLSGNSSPSRSAVFK